MPPKRKRNDRASEAGGNRPAPHRPAETVLGQHDRDFYNGPSSQNRRASGGGRNTRRNADRRESSNNQYGGNANTRGPTSPTVARPSSSSSQVAPLAVPTTPITPHPNHLRSPASTGYGYLILTGPRLAAWQHSGRQEVVEHGITSRVDEDVEEISTIAQEFIHAVLENRLTPTDAGNCIKQILGPEPGDDETDYSFDPQTLFLDTISVFVDSDDAISRSLLRDFVAATELSPRLLRKVLDAPALQQLGLIRDSFVKLGIRYATNQLYRQANFNLLREESEGYSKLAAELYRTPMDSREHDFALVQACWERVKGLIGTFDLDVGRVLDVVIDVFSATMLRNIVFFTRFLRIGSWWPRNQIEQAERVFAGGLPNWALRKKENMNPDGLKAELAEQCHQRDLGFWDRAREVHLDAFFELGGRQVDDAELERFTKNEMNSNANVNSKLNWMRTTRTLPPNGNRVAAQLLGFKFRYYVSEARDKSETLPANLYYLAAFLIKIGFISLPDLYPHLWPEDEQMDALKERRLKELAEKERTSRQTNEPNALLAAGALTDDTLPTVNSKPRDHATSKAENKDQEAANKKTDEETVLPIPQEAHKADLVSHLLVAGAIPEALYMIGRFPWLPEAYPDDIYPAINRIISHAIGKVYQENRHRELRPRNGNHTKPDISVDVPGMAKGALKLVDGLPVKVLKWPHADGINKGTLYRYYLDEWADNVPICQTVDDIFTLCNTLLNISGVNIGRDATLVKKLAIIGQNSFRQDRSPGNLARWQDILRRLLIPSLCLTDSNVDTALAVWALLKHFPTHVRYNIYAECYEGQISRLPAMVRAFKTSRLDTLATLKRLAFDNIPASAKKLAKIASSSPGIVCKVALEQIEAYSNLIEAFVECPKYFTELGNDVLVWSLLSALGGKQRSRTQETSVLLTSRWLQALAKFTGKVFRRYTNLDSAPVLRYVNDQVAHGSSTDLVILKELITSMAGIVPDVDFTDAQLAALSGGEMLRRQALIALGDQRFESRRSASRFMKALVQTGVASQLLTNMAQYRQSAIYHLPENETHIKYLATVVDESQQALAQYVDLLRSNLVPEKFDALVPSIPRLMTDFGLDANLAFLIGRASLAYYTTGAGKLPTTTRRLSTDQDGDSIMGANEDDTSATPVVTSQPTEEIMEVDTQAIGDKPSDRLGSPLSNAQKSDRFSEVLSPIVEAVRPLLPSSTWEKITPDFFVLFWSLQTGDLESSKPSYKAEFARLDKEGEALKRDRSDMSRNGMNIKQGKIEALGKLAKELTNELSISQERISRTKLLLIKQSSTWLSSSSKIDTISDTLIEECLIPRILLSPADADFGHRIIKFLHIHRVPGFKLASLYNRFFNVNRLRSIIFGCTVREAEFLGRFIKLTLGELSQWHKDKSAYENDAASKGKLGFATALDDEGKPVSFMEHDQFRDLLWTWHRNLFTALRTCLGGTEWMHIRNAITVLKSGLEYFPAVDFMGKQLSQSLQKIAERESAVKGEHDEGQAHRVDLAVTANTAVSSLKKYASKWVLVQDFRSNTSGEGVEEKRATESKRPSQPTNLRPSAPEFKPQPTSTSRPTKTKEAEDGEVKDAKVAPSDAQPTWASRKEPEPARNSTPQRDISQKPPAASQKPDSRPTTARSSTPKAAPAPSAFVSSGKQDPSKPSVLPSMPTAHGLPSRPEVPFPAHFTHDQYGQIKLSREREREREHREARESREPRDSRESRDARDTRDPKDVNNPRDSKTLRPLEDVRTARGRDHQPNERRTESIARDVPRPEKDRQPHRSEIVRDSTRDSSRRVEPVAHDRDSHGQQERPPPSIDAGQSVETSRAQTETQPATRAPPPPLPHDPQGPPVNPERARLINADRPDDRSVIVNPARAALINDVRPTSSRPSREQGRDHNSPRPLSPRRGERVDTSRDERLGRPHRPDQHINTRDLRNEVPSPVGPKPSRGMESHGDRPPIDRSREQAPLQGAPPGSRAETSHGRLNQDPNYGRLNQIASAPDTNSFPEGPRGRGRNLVRAPANNPQGRPEPRFQSNEPIRPPTPDRHQPPTGPASSRPRRGQPGGQYGQGPIGITTPAESPSGMHPERARQLNVNHGPVVPPPPSVPYPAGGPAPIPVPVPPPVHPDRMGHIAPLPGPPPRLANHPMHPSQTPERQPMPGPPNHRQPPVNHPITPSADANNPMSAPTGPSQGSDRRTGGRRQLSGINNILQQGGPGMRQRSSRSNMSDSDARVLTGASPISTPVQERPELIFPNDHAAIDRPVRGDHDRGRRDHDNLDRSSRSTRRSSRDRSPEREQRLKDPREYRERKSGTGGPSHGREGERESRRSGREPSGAVRELLPGSGRSDMMSDGRDITREPRHRGEGGGRHEEFGRGGGGRGGGIGTGGQPRGGDDRREPRGEERGRKRRSDEFTEIGGKRQRR